MNNQNMRHLKLIIDLIDNYNSEKIDYVNFVNRLDEIIHNFDHPPANWIKVTKSLWFNLEEINSFILDDSKNSKKIENFKTNINAILNELINHIKLFNQNP